MASQYVNSLKIGNYTYTVGDVVRMQTTYLSDYSYKLAYTYSGEYVRTNTWQITQIVNPEYYAVGSKYYPIYPLKVKAYSGDMSAGAGFAGTGILLEGSGGTPDTYTITFNANGGSGGPGTQTKTHGVTMTISSTQPTRSGYTFLGWSTSSTATSASYSAGGSYSANGTATLYAVWRLNSYTVSYNANGGSGAPSAQTKTHGTNLTLSSTTPTRTGYTFLGWSTSSTATSATYGAGGTYSSNSSATLYAVWSEHYLTINHYSNGADYCTYKGVEISVSADQNVIVATEMYKYDDSPYTDGLDNVENTSWLYLSKTNHKPTGYWGTETTGGTLVNQDTPFTTGQSVAQAFGLSLVNGNQTVNVYAQWELDSYDVNYDDGFGEGSGTTSGTAGMPQVGSGTIGQGTTISTSVPVKSGYTFLGWATQPGADIAEYQPGDTLPAGTSNVTLYAVWDVWTHTVNYNLNGGSGSIPSFTKATGDDSKISSTIPTKSGSTFLYWSTTQSSGGTKYSPGASYTHTQDGGEVTLYAIWANSAIIFYSNGYVEANSFAENSSLEKVIFDGNGMITVKTLIE